MSLIPQDQARIGWGLLRNKNLDFDFQVIRIIPGKEEPKCFKILPLTWGNCSAGWNELDEKELGLSILRIFFDHHDWFSKKDSQFIKECLRDVGKIEPLQSIRKMVYKSYYNDWPYEEFFENFYS